MFKFEKSHQKIISLEKFASRLFKTIAFAALMIIGSLLIGIAGYHYLEGFSWLDSFLNASMILGGMGEVDPLKTDGGKIFAGIYALYSGLVIMVTTGIILAPVIHRVLHSFHVKD